MDSRFRGNDSNDSIDYQRIVMQTLSLTNLFLSFLRLGTTAFGGPSMIPYIRKMTLAKNWSDERNFDDGIAFCQTIPGATAMQMTAYVGLRARGIAGAAASFIGFGLPAFILMMILSALYVRFHTLPTVISAFSGLRAIIIAIMANAAFSFAKSTIKSWRNAVSAGFCAVLFGLKVNPIFVIITAAVGGILLFPKESISQTEPPIAAQKNSFWLILLILLVFFSALTAMFFLERRLFDLSVLMAKIDLIAFGGGFVSIPLMFRYIVENNSWMNRPTFLDGIALGQITPGPIVITSTFIGFIVAGSLGGIIATLSMFLPSFLMVTALAPYYDRLRARPVFRTAITGIMSSFVGFLAVVTLNFAIDMNWNPTLAILSILSLTALLLKVDILWVVAVGTVVSILFI
jgi:chromate transporter